ncbi:outer membrane protein assembly factor [Parabacteroides sp. Marseille-P3160]|uniref:BamA/OMP85 family outer membrane protein n=1 Tax=Parabacteroides sp. Marseille-P3160 TaxID=1917887 RepID=UPI0009BB0714|nr:POTRA domain-containing protein [Parabacteroides sp. Marseille-P3160]
MQKRFVLLFLFLSAAFLSFAQESDTTHVEPIDSAAVPLISYSYSPKRYKIEDIKVTGAKNYEDFVLINFSGLSVGDEVTIPGDEITDAVKRFWKHGLFSDIKILATKIVDDKVWLDIQLKQRPRISEVRYHGVKKGEREDLEAKLGLKKGFQITPNVMDRAKDIIKKHFDAKGFKNVDVEINQKDDVSREGEVIVDIVIDKNEKTKIEEITIDGNQALSDADIKKAMKKTNERFNLKQRFKTSLREFFSTKKFTTEEYTKDKENIISKYNELGYRDAVILSDTVYNVTEKRVKIELKVDEGDKYFLRDIQFVGNTHYSTDQLGSILNMKPGEVYNQKKLMERLQTDEDAVSNVYYNNGYLFFGADPVEVEVENDSIALEIRIQEGPQATINKVIINGNDRLYEDIVRRELRTKPGMLFSREDLMRSIRELAQMGHFDPENMNPVPLPDPDNGTVDIQYNLVSKANDQVEFSAGWGQTGVIGKLSLKFTNFSMKNFLHPKTYKGIIPQGEGQTLTLSGQTNGRYYQAYSISFLDPWFGGKRPNTLSVSAYYSKMTDISSNYMSNLYSSSMYNSYYPYGSYGGYGYGGYGNYGNYELAYDPDKSIQMIGVSAGYGKRLNWPDDYFQFMATLNYQVYIMKDWNYFLVTNGTSHNINLELMLQRNSIDNPLYTRSGSQFSASVAATPPYSLWDGKDYASMASNDESKYKMIEYHKWKFKAKVFSPLARLPQFGGPKRTPVLMTRAEFGFLGSYDKNKKSPFETFYVGGDGMSGYSTTYATETIGLRGYDNGEIAGNNSYLYYGYAYSRLSMELRYPFLLEPSSTIYGLAFVEGGNAWGDISSFSPFDLKRSAGFGVRIFLPMIGLMGIDWAYGFDKPYGSTERGGSHFHFILGQEF